ncbi:MAG TPA: hypothetical protein VE620_03795, partial [Myxococcales bacterium]|nr:hypothetical protein [Myxococcales bacterium]
MLLRRVAPAALAISALTACEPGVGYDASHAAPTNYAVYDLAASPPDIPQPNDLALQQAAVIPGAQGELLRLFASQRGFPNDQEVPVTLDLVKITTATGGVQTRSAPKPDLSSFKPCTGPGQNCNVAVIDLATLAFVPDIAVPVATDFAVSGDHGTLSIRRSPRPTAVGASTRTWDPGKHYVAVLRGGPNGITVDSGQPIAADPTLYILEQGKNLTDPANQTLLPGNTPAEKAAVGAQLEPIREFLENGPFQVASSAFPKSEIASITTFPVAPASTNNPTHPVVDSGSGVIPLPFNALLDGSTLPDDPLAPAVGAHVQNLPLTFGPLADGIASLDGFSTTAFVFAPMSSFVVVATGNDPNPASTLTGNIFLYEITDPNSPIFLSGTNSYDDLLPGPLTPAPVRGGGPTIWVAPVVGVQPAAATRPTSTQPLKEAAEYAVIITNGITDTAGKPIGRPTLGNILLFQNPLWANGKSQLAGISDAQAKALERMRAQIANLLSNLGGGAPFTRDQIALAYTFRTQTVTSLSLQLAAAPYDPAKSPSVNFLSANVLTPAAAFAKYRVDTAAPASVAFDNIQEVIEASLPTPNLLSNTSGAFDPNLFAPGATPPVEVIPALIVVPNAPAITTSCPPPADTLKCAPLVVFHHGLSGGRAQMLLGANELAGQGF